MLFIVCGLLILINTKLLFFSIASLETYFAIYFLFTQGLLTWYIIDLFSYKYESNWKALPGVKKIAFPQPATPIELGSGTDKKISFELAPDVNFSELVESSINLKSCDDIYSFVEKTQDEKNQSQLEVIDHFVNTIRDTHKKLLVTNLQSPNQSTTQLVDVLLFQAEEYNLICRDISPHTDLIPHLGDLNKISGELVKNYFTGQSSHYDKIIFFLSKEEIQLMKSCLFEPESYEVPTFVPHLSHRI